MHIIPLIYLDGLFVLAVSCLIPTILRRRKAFLHWRRIRGTLTKKSLFGMRGQTLWYSYVFQNAVYEGRDYRLSMFFDPKLNVNIGDEISLFVNPVEPEKNFIYRENFGMVNNPYGEMILLIACLLGLAHLVNLFQR